MSEARGCGCGNHPLHGMSRRDVIRWGAAAAGITALGPWRGVLPTATAAPRNLKRLVVVNMFGGNDSLNMFIPVTLQPYFTRRTDLVNPANTIAIPEGSALPLGGSAATTRYRLHPSLPKIAALWAEGKVAAVNRVGYPQANLSHFSSMDIMSYGVRNGFSGLGIPTSGWAARFADAYAPTPLGAVALGVGRMLDFEGGTTSPFLANDLGQFNIAVNRNSSPQLYRLETARSVLGNWSGTGNSLEARKALSQAHDLVDQVQAALTSFSTTVTYSNAFLSRRLRDVAVLIQGGFETRLFYTGFGGFDTHGAQGSTAGAHATLMTQLDDAVGSLAQELKNMGIWDSTVVAVITEFGRRNYVNGSAGTDHGHAFTELLVGGAVRGGVYGPDLVDADLASEYPAYAVDFRSIYKEILQVHMGADPAPVFPEALPIDATLGVV